MSGARGHGEARNWGDSELLSCPADTTLSIWLFQMHLYHHL